MVTRGSPKPLLRVRILLPLLKKTLIKISVFFYGTGGTVPSVPLFRIDVSLANISPNYESRALDTVLSARFLVSGTLLPVKFQVKNNGNADEHSRYFTSAFDRYFTFDEVKHFTLIRILCESIFHFKIQRRHILHSRLFTVPRPRLYPVPLPGS